MNLTRLCRAAVWLVVSSTCVSGLWSQSSDPVPIVSPDQVVARIHGLNESSDTEAVDRPQPIQLESFDFAAQIGGRRGANDGSAPAPFVGAMSAAPVGRAAVPPTIYRAERVGTAVPGNSAVEQAGYQPRTLDGAAAHRAGGIADAPTPQEAALTVPVQTMQPVADAATPVFLPTAPDGMHPQVQVFPSNEPGICHACNGAGCDLCSGTTGHTPYDLAQVSSQFECCGFVSCARYYAVLDYLRWDIENTRVAAGNLGGVTAYDTSDGLRLTLGHRWDANSGLELTYFGFTPWEAETTATSAGGALTAGLVPFGGITAAQLNAFDNNVSLVQNEQVRLHAFDVMDTLWGWDVVKTSWGFRYLYFDEQFQLTATNNVAQTGVYDLEMTNFMFGPQLGLEMFYDIGYRLSFSFSTKVAGFLNFNRGDTLLVNNGTVVIDATDRDTSWAASGDVGFYAHYQLLPRVRARVGYDVLALWQMATVAENYTPFIGPPTGLEYSESDEVFFHGASAGIEIYR